MKIIGKLRINNAMTGTDQNPGIHLYTRERRGGAGRDQAPLPPGEGLG